MAGRHLKAADIHRRLLETFDKSRVPDLRTVERRVKALTPADKSAPWRLRDAHPEDVPSVLLVQVVVRYRTEGRRAFITTEEAAWIVRIMRVVPALLPWEVYLITKEYMLRADDQAATQRVDDLLGALVLRQTLGTPITSAELSALWYNWRFYDAQARGPEALAALWKEVFGDEPMPTGATEKMGGPMWTKGGHDGDSN